MLIIIGRWLSRDNGKFRWNQWNTVIIMFRWKWKNYNVIINIQNIRGHMEKESTEVRISQK